MTKLKPLPCPVCGKEPKVAVHKVDGKVVWSTVICETGDRYSWHRLEAGTVHAKTVIKRWNRMVSK